MTDYYITIRQNFGYCEEVRSVLAPTLVILLDELDYITRWANETEIESLKATIEHGSWDFEEGDLVVPLYDDNDPLDGDYAHEIIIERIK